MKTKPTRALLVFALFSALALTQRAAAAQSCAMPANAEAQIAVVLAQTNAERAARGIPPLRTSETLMRVAQSYACTMVVTNKLSHRGPDGKLPKARIRSMGCRSSLTAENIAMGFSSGDSTMNLWMSSSGHRRNILLRGVNSVGIGVAAPKPGQGGGPRWVQVFARGC